MRFVVGHGESEAGGGYTSADQLCCTVDVTHLLYVTCLFIHNIHTNSLPFYCFLFFSYEYRTLHCHKLADTWRAYPPATKTVLPPAVSSSASSATQHAIVKVGCSYLSFNVLIRSAAHRIRMFLMPISLVLAGRWIIVRRLPVEGI